MALSEEHYALLRESSGLSDAVIQLRGYRTVPQDELMNACVAGMYDEAGLRAEGAIGFNVYRPDGKIHCEVMRLNKVSNDRKYLWPNGVRQAVDVFPGHLEYVADPTIPLIIAEGTKKVDAIVSHIPEGEKYCVIGINGCWGWRSRVGDKDGKASIASPDFLDIALEGRKIITVPDSDYLTNTDVKKGWDGCGEYLASKTKQNRLHICVIPPRGLKKQGADDFLLTHPLEEMLSLCRSIDIKFDVAEPDLNWLSMEDVLQEKDEVKWLVENLLPMGGIGLMVGHTRSYKTWLAMRLCLDVIRGRNAWEHPALPVTEPAHVLYVNMEMVRAMIKDRMSDFLIHQDIHSDEIDTLMKESFFVLDNKAFDLRNSDHVTWLIEHIQQDNIKLGVIDTFSMVWQGNENDAGDIGAFFKTMRMISEVTGITWLILHHMAKPNRERNEQHQMFAIRGSGQILQQVDMAIGVEVVKEEEESVEIKISNFKSRSAAELAPWLGKFERPMDTKARNIAYGGEYVAVSRGKSKVAQEEFAVLEFLRKNGAMFEVGIAVTRFNALITAEPGLQDMGVSKTLRYMREHVTSGVLRYDETNQSYYKGERYDDILIESIDGNPGA